MEVVVQIRLLWLAGLAILYAVALGIALLFSSWLDRREQRRSSPPGSVRRGSRWRPHTPRVYCPIAWQEPSTPKSAWTTGAITDARKGCGGFCLKVSLGCYFGYDLPLLPSVKKRGREDD